MPELAAWWPALAAGGAFLTVWLLYLSVDSRAAGARRRSPFAEEFVKAPGHALRRAVEAAGRRLTGALLFAAAWPLLVFGAWAGAAWIGGLPRTEVVDLAAGALIGVGWLGGVGRVLMAERRFRRLRTALDAEIVTGEILSDLRAAGCRVLHDVMTPAGRASHVVVSPSAVYAVRTLARPRSRRGRGKEDVTVFVTGDELRFPGGTDRGAVPRARKTAMALAEALRHGPGRTVEVRPVVLLPGWYVESRVDSDVQVMNPRDARRLAASAQAGDPASVDRVVADLETLARDARAAAPRRRPAVERREPTL